MNAVSQSVTLNPADGAAPDLEVSMVRLRRRLMLLGGLALVGILLLLVMSNVLHSQQRRGDLQISEMIRLATQQSISTERLLRHLSFLDAQSDGARMHDPLTPTLQVDHPDTREKIVDDVRQLRRNFAALAMDMQMRQDFATHLRTPLAESRQQLDELTDAYTGGLLTQGQTIGRMLELGARLEPLHRELTAHYSQLRAANLRQLQVQEGWARLGFVVLVTLLVSLLLMPALREVRWHARELALSRRRAGHIVSATRIGTWSYTAQTRVFHVDERWTELLGYPAGSMTAIDIRGLRSLLHPHDQPRLKEAVTSVAGSPAELHQFDFRMRHYNGHWIWIRSVVTVLSHDAQGQPLEVAGVHIDISEQVRQRLDLERALAQAAAASRAKSVFLANMSHEIRTPLTSITGYADLLDDDYFRSQPGLFEEAIVSIRSNARHLLAVINDVLDVSRIEAGRMIVERLELQPVAVVNDVLALLKPQALARSLELSVLCDGDIPNTIRSDPTRLRQILINLVGNAIKFTAHGAVTLALACRRDDAGQARLSFTVCDTGVGMSPDELARIRRFDAFSQADESMSRRFGGSGLGLRICHELARMLGGEILVESRPGRGSRFEFVLNVGIYGELEMRTPESERGVLASDRGAASADVPPARIHEQALAGRRILLAEDGHDNQRLIGYHLRRVGADLLICDNGVSALKMLAKCRAEGVTIDLLVSDIQMPGMDGYALVRAVRDCGECLPVLALTAHAMEQDRQQCLATGFDDYASKPIRSAELIGKCVALIAGRDAGVGCYTSDHERKSPRSASVA